MFSVVVCFFRHRVFYMQGERLLSAVAPSSSFVLLFTVLLCFLFRVSVRCCVARCQRASARAVSARKKKIVIRTLSPCVCLVFVFCYMYLVLASLYTHCPPLFTVVLVQRALLALFCVLRLHCPWLLLPFRIVSSFPLSLSFPFSFSTFSSSTSFPPSTSSSP